MSDVFATGQIISSGGAMLLIAEHISEPVGITTFDGSTIAPVSSATPQKLSEKEWLDLRIALEDGFVCDGEFTFKKDVDSSLVLTKGNWLISRALGEGMLEAMPTGQTQQTLGAVLNLASHISSGASQSWPIVSVRDLDLPPGRQTDMPLTLMAEADRLRVAAPDGRYVDIGHDRGTMVLHIHDGQAQAIEPLVANIPEKGPITIEEYAYRAEREAVLA